MSAGVTGITVVHVSHASAVAAIPTADGPRALLASGLVERLEARGLDVHVVEVAGPDAPASGPVAQAFGVAGAVARRVREAREANRLVFVLSGSCQVGLGSMSGLPGDRRGVVWMDAHGDFNVPATSASGLLDGMVLAAITGRCWQKLSDSVPGFSPLPDDRVALLGVRNLDTGEEALLDESRVAYISPKATRVLGPPILQTLGEETDTVYLHIDLDVLDPDSVAPANAFAEKDGLHQAEMEELLDVLMEHCSVGAVGLASYDPAHDPSGAVARVAVELLEGMARRAVGD